MIEYWKPSRQALCLTPSIYLDCSWSILLSLRIFQLQLLYSEVSCIVAMFKVSHEKYLKESIWESGTTGRAEYIEVWKYANVRNILIGHIRLQNDLIVIRRRKIAQLIIIAMAS